MVGEKVNAGDFEGSGSRKPKIRREDAIMSAMAENATGVFGSRVKNSTCSPRPHDVRVAKPESALP